jgi:integrase
VKATEDGDASAHLGRLGMRLHDLRHGCASLLLAQGVPARVVMEVLGHSQISMTLDTYSHVGADLLGDAAKAMNASLRPA